MATLTIGDAPVRPPGRSLVEEVISKRRWEAACEDAESKGLPKPLSDFVSYSVASASG
jgi:hypothetical protein